MASRVLSKYAITDVDIATGDAFLIEFCRVFEKEYGKSCVTPNMHMAHGLPYTRVYQRLRTATQFLAVHF